MYSKIVETDDTTMVKKNKSEWGEEKMSAEFGELGQGTAGGRPCRAPRPAWTGSPLERRPTSPGPIVVATLWPTSYAKSKKTIRSCIDTYNVRGFASAVCNFTSSGTNHLGCILVSAPRHSATMLRTPSSSLVQCWKRCGNT